jgi:hypothetical protein
MTPRLFSLAWWRRWEAELLAGVVLVAITLAVRYAYRHAPPPPARSAALPATASAFRQPEVVMVDTSVNVICYKIQGQIACVWIQSAARVRHQLGID